jgi:aspartyl-tRNA synthetase
MLRSHTCGELRAAHIGQTVRLCGWVNRVRNHGGFAFVDLRDRYGLTQVVLDPQDAPAAFADGAGLAAEWVLAVEGVVRVRPEGQANVDMATGEVEVLARSLVVLNPSQVPPFEVARELNVDDGQRLRYRYLDLRRARMRRNLLLRHEVTSFIRAFLNGEDFVEVETPILMRATPEGARDFLVPSRVHPGKFYALPQSPQQLKQLLMVAGLDRYYQIARCFRDEDLRADRELEFTQVDMELSFVEAQDIMAINERLFLDLVRSVTPELRIRETPFPHISYRDAMERYGSDKPDMRFGLELVDLAPALVDTGFRVFASILAEGGRVKAVTAPQTFTRREIDELEALMKELGAAGLAWLTCEAGGEHRGSVAKALGTDEQGAIVSLAGAEPGHTVFIVAGKAALVAKCLGRLRQELARRLNLIPEGELCFAWLVEPPLFEWNEDQGRWDSVHHPFTAPDPRDLALLDSDPGQVRAMAYDIICNGYELGGGSIRIHDRAIQQRVFALLGLSAEQTEAQFGHLLRAFDFGAPPHGGIAWGLDRTVAILAGETNIREVIAFPKSLSAVDLLTGAPSSVPIEDVHILGLRLAASDPPDATAASLMASEVP